MPKILLVEDDEMIVRLYKKTLELAGFEVDTADNGLSALEQLPISKPDIILLDIMMPTMNGVQFLGKINAGVGEGKYPVIVLTNVSDPDVTFEAVNAGASLVLVKSETEPDDVVATVNKVLSKEILQTGSLDDGDDSLEG